MKVHSIQFKVLLTVISAMLAITVLVGGLSIYEVDRIIRDQTEIIVTGACKTEAAQINDTLSNMEGAVKIVESSVLTLLKNGDIADRSHRSEVIRHAEKMFADVIKRSDKVIAYYLRFAPELSDSRAGLFYSKPNGSSSYIRLDPIDLSLYEKDDVEHVGWYWQPYEAQKPVWLKTYRNLNNGVPVISYAVPLYHNDRFIGVVGMDFDYTALTDRAQKIKVYDRGFVHLEADCRVISSERVSDPDITDASDADLRVSRELANGMTLVLSVNNRDIHRLRYSIVFKLLLAVLILAGLFSLIAILVVRKIVSPLKELTVASKKLATGDYDVEIVHSDTYEINRLSAAFENMILRLREHEEQQRFLTYHDPLTGLRNAIAYNTWVREFDLEIQRRPVDFGILVFDLNHLKKTNDNYGHDAGNKLIMNAAQIIAHTFRGSPVFRVGGDEFVVILQNDDLVNCINLLDRFDWECSHTSMEDIGPDVTISVAKGLAIYDPDWDKKFVDVFNRADEAMYEDKQDMKSSQG